MANLILPTDTEVGSLTSASPHTCNQTILNSYPQYFYPFRQEPARYAYAHKRCPCLSTCMECVPHDTETRNPLRISKRFLSLLRMTTQASSILSVAILYLFDVLCLFFWFSLTQWKNKVWNRAWILIVCDDRRLIFFWLQPGIARAALLPTL